MSGPAPACAAALDRWYLNIPVELGADQFDRHQRRYLVDYYTEAGLLSDWRRPYFLAHFSTGFGRVVEFLEAAAPRQGTLLDLGCGTGTQALFMAASGWKVVGIDMNPEAISIALQRKRYYEKMLGRPLDATFIAGDVFTYDLAEFAPFSAAYSVFAFNLMQPTAGLIPRVSCLLGADGAVAILDGSNDCLWARLGLRRPTCALAPRALAKIFKDNGFAVNSHEGVMSMPPWMWRGPKKWVHGMNRLASSSWLFPVSQCLCAVRRHTTAAPQGITV